ncbi:MAG TPA: hypothetical protein VG408_08645 [Actinomycetota bacterium]|nr:hypothetical protein [Actinomycetota bacterium]
MADKRRLVDRVTDPVYTEGLEERPLEELRAMRDECKEGEHDASFERRLCQARVDILTAELSRREGKGEGDLLQRLPEILATEGHDQGGPLPERAPDLSIPRAADIPRRRVEEIVGERTLARLPQIPDEEIRGIIESLREHEAEVSARRKALQGVLDRIQQEMMRRFKSGEADPTAALG